MEIELKLALPPRHAARIRRNPLLQGSKPVRRTLHSIYFDTPAFDLMQRGIALRVRRVGYHWVQTLKAETRAVGALSSRPEWETAVAGGGSPDFAVLPPAALALLRGIHLKRITPVFITEFQRTAWHIVRGDNEAELALDMGEIRSGEARHVISEIEIELKAGAPEFLFELATGLLADIPLLIEPRSKAERGYALCGAINPAPVRAVLPQIDPQQSAGEAWEAVVRAALVQMVANIPGFIDNAHDIEYLHQFRIALRRLRTGVSLAKALGQAAPGWDQPTRELMRRLNAARDWDVFLHETLPKLLASLNEAEVEDAVLALVRDVAAKNRLQAQALLQAPAFTQLVLDIGRNLLARQSTTVDATTWAAKILEKRWLTLRKRCRGFTRLNPVQRHQARIAAKKLRYAADAFAPLYGKRGKHFIAALAALQNGLGRSNDAHVGAQLLRALPKKSVLLSFDLGRLDGVLEAEATRHATLSGAVWRRLARSRLFWRG